MAQLYVKKRSDGLPKAVEGTDTGELYCQLEGDDAGTLADVKAAVEALAACIVAGKVQVDTEINATLDPTGLATQATAAAILAKLIAAPATEATLALIGAQKTPASNAKTVTTAGTAVAVGGDVAARSLVIIADLDNAGNIYVGSSAVDAATGAKLPPGGVLPCGNVNLSAIYIDSDYNLEGISYYYTT